MAHLEETIQIVDGMLDDVEVINEIIARSASEDAFYVCDVRDIVAKLKMWQEAMPRVEPFYAVKCNDSPIVLATLAALGVGFDCASRAEIANVLHVGVDASRIIFANPAKPVSHIAYAHTKHIALMTFDGDVELDKVKRFAPEAKLVLRIRCDDEEAQIPLGIKFGCDAHLEAFQLLQLAQTMGISVIGISFHLGFGCVNANVFYNAIAIARKLFDYTETELGYKMVLLDIGGGYPGNRGCSLDKIAYNINKGLNEFFQDESVRIIAEPGTFFVASAFTLVCNIIAMRTIHQDGNRHKMYFINDGVYGSFNGLHKLGDIKVTPKFLKHHSDVRYPSSLWGPTLDSIDNIARTIMMPELCLGDWMFFINMGAYTLTAASTFNGFPTPKVYSIVDQSTWNAICKHVEIARNEKNFVCM